MNMARKTEKMSRVADVGRREGRGIVAFSGGIDLVLSRATGQ